MADQSMTHTVDANSTVFRDFSSISDNCFPLFVDRCSTIIGKGKGGKKKNFGEEIPRSGSVAVNSVL